MKRFFGALAIAMTVISGGVSSAEEASVDVCAVFFDWQQPYFDAFGVAPTDVPYPVESRWIGQPHGKFVGSDDRLFETELIQAGFGSDPHAFEKANPGAWDRVAQCIDDRFRAAPEAVLRSHRRRLEMLRAHGRRMEKNTTLPRADAYGMPLMPPMSELQQRASTVLYYRMQLDAWREDWEARKADGLLVVDVIVADLMLKEFRRVLWPEAVADWQAEVAGMKAARNSEIAGFSEALVGVQPQPLSPYRMRIVTARFVTEPMAYLRNIVLAEMARDQGAALAGSLVLPPTCVGPFVDLEFCRD
jgi:hypothetical protein